MYCDAAAFETCARYQLSLEMKSVPLDLLPNGSLLAGFAVGAGSKK